MLGGIDEMRLGFVRSARYVSYNAEAKFFLLAPFRNREEIRTFAQLSVNYY